MRRPATLFRSSAAATLSRLLLILGLLLGDLIPDPRAAQAAPGPVDAANLTLDQTAAILPSEGARIAAALPQHHASDALLPQTLILPSPATGASSATPAPAPASPARATRLRPFPQGPPAV